MEVSKDYENNFTAKDYLADWCTDQPNIPLYRYSLTQIHNFWQGIGADVKGTLLEYGGGPSIHSLISACPRVENIVFQEFNLSCREAVRTWQEKKPGAFDWSAALEFVVKELEGKDQDAVARREEELRQKIRAIVPGDIRPGKEELQIPHNLMQQYGPPYDVVSTYGCIDVVAESPAEVKADVAKLVKLLKPGGLFIMFSVLGCENFMCGSQRFFAFPLSKELVIESLKEAGLEDVTFTSQDVSPREDMTFFYQCFSATGKAPLH